MVVMSGGATALKADLVAGQPQGLLEMRFDKDLGHTWIARQGFDKQPIALRLQLKSLP